MHFLLHYGTLAETQIPYVNDDLGQSLKVITGNVHTANVDMQTAHITHKILYMYTTMIESLTQDTISTSYI